MHVTSSKIRYSCYRTSQPLLHRHHSFQVLEFQSVSTSDIHTHKLQEVKQCGNSVRVPSAQTPHSASMQLIFSEEGMTPLNTQSSARGARVKKGASHLRSDRYTHKSMLPTELAHTFQTAHHTCSDVWLVYCVQKGWLHPVQV